MERNPDAHFRLGPVEISILAMTIFALVAIPAARIDSDGMRAEREVYKANMRMKAVRALAKVGRYLKRTEEGEVVIVDGPVRP